MLMEQSGVCAAKHAAPSSGEAVQLQYTHPNGALYHGDSLVWLASLEAASVDMVFADPPYNIKKEEWDDFNSDDEYIEWSLTWIGEVARVLKPTGSLYICGYSEILADIRRPASRHFRACRWLVWHYRNKANLGSYWGRSHESILHLRKSERTGINIDNIRIPYGAHTLRYPARAQAHTSAFHRGHKRNTWVPHPDGAKPKDVIDIPTTCNGMGEKTRHPTQKPEALMRKFVFASSNPGELVIDPFSGSGTTLVVAEQLGRRWMGCDLNREYNLWAVDRLENIRRMSIDDWIDYDRKSTTRREGIR